MLAGDPTWVRTCEDCRGHTIGADGKPLKFPQPDGRGGVVELPLALDAGQSPPCGVCPKVPAGRPKHWDHAAEFEPWFWGVLRWFDESRAVGDFGRPDPLMRACAAVIDRCRRKRERGELVQEIAAALRQSR